MAVEHTAIHSPDAYGRHPGNGCKSMMFSLSFQTRNMKRIAILVIAATNQPVYRHYIKNYWRELIAYTNAEKQHIDVFLLFENSIDIGEFNDLGHNIIQDPRSDLTVLCRKEHQTAVVPGILAKTVYALELLQGNYDVFFRTNLSSVIKLTAFDQFVQAKNRICYSGAFVWSDFLRQDLLKHGRIGPEKSIKTLEELDDYEGNTFIGGSGYFLSADEAGSLVARKNRIRYDIVDDISVGLMFSEHEHIPGFNVTITPETAIDDMMRSIRQSNACHIRLQHFPVETAAALWKELKEVEIWRH